MATSLINEICYLVPIVATFNELKKHMSRRHWEILYETPFAHQNGFRTCIAGVGVLDALMQMYDDASSDPTKDQQKMNAYRLQPQGYDTHTWTMLRRRCCLLQTYKRTIRI